MTKIDDMKFEWWKLACEKNPDPVSFVDTNDMFVFCNKAWCKLLGYSESELKNKTWQDITRAKDISGDQSEVDSVKRGDKDEYYIEKKYIKKDGSEVSVRLYVHRYPESGDHEGYVVFASKITSEEYEDLKSKFLDLQKTVLILQQNAVASDFLSTQLLILDQKIEQNKEIAKIALERGNNINIGDKLQGGDYGGNKAGRDNVIGGKHHSILVITISICALIFSLSVASIACYLIMK